ncbi:hypothetical protein IV500_04300 [Paeniglutamicibacter antarcticus]|uniref:Uncharacterized protein n=1 Tax=Arthrobacter terrae TaxID=2935737 RepID=A0A931G9F3_9MICC|nr:hypothetical protein [Arthrobacter terrae]MBG0738642.1 hypothetical protein [Arthrobacter terrae]
MTVHFDLQQLVGPAYAHLISDQAMVTEDQLIGLATKILRNHDVPFTVFQRGDLITEDLGSIQEGKEDAVADALWADRITALKNLGDATDNDWQAINDAMTTKAAELGLEA